MSTVPDTLIVQVDGSIVPTRGPQPLHEVKVGLVVRSEKILSNKGRGFIEDARFVARLGDYEGFKKELTAALNAERASEANRIVVVGDGAPWVWSMADELCFCPVQVLDYPHAAEHASTAARLVFGEGDGLGAMFVEAIKRMLWEGQIEDVIQQLAECALADRGPSREALQDLHRYYTTNASRMRYDQYRAQGLPCGSGSIESAHRHVLQKRMKLAGQHWDTARADRLARLRAGLSTCGPGQIYQAAA
jgi:hypothetical protein